jgi:tetratricopeptide (TPR) repeat protein
MRFVYQRLNSSATFSEMPIGPCNSNERNHRCEFAVRTMMLLTILILAVAAGASATRGQDASIDQLIKKLPPPEKVAKSAIQQSDPAARDPLAQQILAAAKERNFGNALNFSRRLAERYPKSLGAHFIHGQLALALHHLPEARAAFRVSISLQPKFALGYIGVGAVEAVQNHFASALSQFQIVTRLEPKAEIGWEASSGCAERLGRLSESLEYAKRATIVAPSSTAAWLQLARAEKAAGHNQAALNAFSRADQLRRRALAKATPTVR